jgi:RimJ/RimL family protein N-acetyltransferase
VNAASRPVVAQAGGLSIQTARLNLRPVAERDAAATSRLMTEAVARNLCTWPPTMTADEVRARIRDYRRASDAGTRLDLAVIRRSDGELLGWLGFEASGRRQREVNLGFWLGVAHHGRGFMSEAIDAALPAALGHLGAESVAAQVFIDNAASIAILRRVGMELAGAGEGPSKARDGLSPTLLFRRTR